MATVDELAQNVAELTKLVEQFYRLQQAPKQLIRDQSTGRVIGIQTIDPEAQDGGNSKQV